MLSIEIPGRLVAEGDGGGAGEAVMPPLFLLLIEPDVMTGIARMKNMIALVLSLQTRG